MPDNIKFPAGRTPKSRLHLIARQLLKGFRTHVWTIDHSDLSSGASTIISRSVWSNNRRDGRQSRPFFSTRYRRDASIMLINPPTQETLRQGCGGQLLTQGYIGHFLVFQKQTGKGVNRSVFSGWDLTSVDSSLQTDNSRSGAEPLRSYCIGIPCAWTSYACGIPSIVKHDQQSCFLL